MKPDPIKKKKIVNNSFMASFNEFFFHLNVDTHTHTHRDKQVDQNVDTHIIG